MTTLKKIIMAVESEINGVEWSDWDSPLDIIDVYAPDGIDFEENAVTERFVFSVLERAIESNGKTLPSDCRLYERLIWGSLVSFSGKEYWVNMLEKKYA